MDEQLPPYGELGVLAYDEVSDRLQCAICGRWYQAINSMHLRTHGLTVDQYKEATGLNVGTPLLTPRIRSLQRQQALAQHAARQLVTLEQGQTPERAERERYLHRAQYRREQWSPAARQRAGETRRLWTDDDMLAALRAMQAARGGRLRLRDLKDTPPAERGGCPSHTAVIERFGSWRRVCELLGQPYCLGRGKGQGAERVWTEVDGGRAAPRGSGRAAIRRGGGSPSRPRHGRRGGTLSGVGVQAA
jgi:hypothetical protein